MSAQEPAGQDPAGQAPADQPPAGQESAGQKQPGFPHAVPNVTCRATSNQVPGYLDAAHLVDPEGLEEKPPGSGRWILKPEARQWNSQYGVVAGQVNDEAPLVEFDLQQVQTLEGMHVWNLTAGDYSFRGFREVGVQHSADGQSWSFLPQRFELARAEKGRDNPGQRPRCYT